MPNTRRVVAVLFAAVVAASTLSGCAFMARNGQRATGLQSNDWTTFSPTLSTDGRYVVFGSKATNLVPGDTNAVADAFIHDRNTGVTERISVSSAGIEGDGAVDDAPAVSDDGDVVAFASAATNLDPNCTNTVGQIFVRTRSTRTTECISVATNGTQGNFNSGQPHITADGRLVVFDSEATNLVPGDFNFAQDVFVRDLVTDTTERVNLKEDGTESAGWGFWPDISADGLYVSYRSSSGDLDPDCPAGQGQVYVTNRKSDTNECLSVDPAGQPGDNYSDQPRLSADGRYVAFFSAADNLDPTCTSRPGETHAFVRDRDTDTTTCESVDAAGLPADTGALFPELSADGRTMSFLSAATNLDPNCPHPGLGAIEMYVRDLDSGVNTCVSVNAAGAGGGALGSGSLSHNGRLVAFVSVGALIAGDTNAAGDMFVRDTVEGVTTRVSDASVQPDADVLAPDLSGDGRYLVFASDATNLVENDGNGARDIFRRDQLTGEVVRLSVSGFLGVGGNLGSRNPSISSKPSVVAFVSDAWNLVGGDTNGVADVFVRDPGFQTTTRVSVGAGAVQANGASSDPAISANGQFVAFESTATNLDPNCAAAVTTVYVRDRTAGTTACFAPWIGGFQNQAAGSAPSISADGRYVALRSTAGGVLPCGSAGWIVIWDRDTDLADCVAPGSHPDLTTTGTHLAFTSSNAGLDPPCTNGIDQVFVAELATNTITCTSVGRSGAVGNGASGVPSISADGRYIAFRTAATNLAFPGADTNGVEDIVVHDRTLGWTSLASRDMFFEGGNGASDAPAIASDGKLLAFESSATDLVEGDTLGHTDVFVRAAQALWLDPSSARNVVRGATVTLTLRGLGFRPDSVSHSGGDEVTVSNPTYVAPNEFRVDVTAAADAELGPHVLGIQNLGPSWNPLMGTFDDCECVVVT